MHPHTTLLRAQPIQLVLKCTMLPRAQACFFSDPDIQLMTPKTGLNASAVIHADSSGLIT